MSSQCMLQISKVMESEKQMYLFGYYNMHNQWLRTILLYMIADPMERFKLMYFDTLIWDCWKDFEEGTYLKIAIMQFLLLVPQISSYVVWGGIYKQRPESYFDPFWQWLQKVQGLQNMIHKLDTADAGVVFTMTATTTLLHQSQTLM